jgi:limonene-1,2-epoxide hydrolase
MGHEENRQTVKRFWEALERKEFGAAIAELHENFMEEYPQSGERIAGKDNFFGLVTGHPTFPAIKVRRHVGRDDLWVTLAAFDYAGDGSPPWQVCEVQELRDGKISRIEAIFGAPFDAAEWRAQWVERA